MSDVAERPQGWTLSDTRLIHLPYEGKYSVEYVLAARALLLAQLQNTETPWPLLDEHGNAQVFVTVGAEAIEQKQQELAEEND